MSCVKHRVQDDLNAGRLWKARDRLLGARRIDPANQWVLNSLGEIYFKMGDLPAAGGVWLLTSRTDSKWKAAEAAFYERHGKQPGSLVAALHVRARIDRFPPAVQERLRNLQQQLAEEGRFWEPRDSSRHSSRRHPLRNRLIGAGFALIAIFVIVALGVGLYNMVLFVLRAGSG